MTQQVLQILKAAGIRAEYGYPAAEMPDIRTSVAAVNLLSADLDQGIQSFGVRLLTPSGQGATACSEAAFAAAQCLSAAGGSCSISEATVDLHTGMISALVTAQFVSRDLDVRIGNTQLPYVTGFRSSRAVDEYVLQLEYADWHFRIEEFYPDGTVQSADPEPGFTLRVGNSESYTDCKWTGEQRIREKGGIRRIREGTSPTRESEM